jgi:hypothetical protein
VGGLVYDVGGLTLTCKRERQHWLMVVRRGTTILPPDKVDMASARAREKWLSRLPDLQPAEGAALRDLLPGLAVVLTQDEDAWRNWQVNQHELAAQRKAAADALEAEAQRAEAAAREAEAEAARASALEGEAAKVLDRDSLLFDVKERVAERGVVGEAANIGVLYLVFASQILDESINAVVKGESSGGKSWLVESVLSVLPENRVYDISSMSDKALIYDERPVSHRSMVIAEVHGQSEAAQYLMRTLISEGRVKHWVTEKVDGRFVTREIVREGPTNFVTTTTAPRVHDENETRLWTLAVDDSPEITRRVLKLQALRAEGKLPTVDTQAWRDAFEWLALAGASDAVVPYASSLVAELPAEPLRIRRDFHRLLAAIRICAVVHQRQRQRDSEGRVIATLSDYGMVRALLADTFKVAVEGVTPKTLQLVAKVQELHSAKVSALLAAGKYEEADMASVTVAELQKAFRKKKRTVQSWAQPAVELGLLADRNHEQRGKPMLLHPGECTVAERSALPAVQTLADACQESVTWVDPLTGERQNIFPTPPPVLSDCADAHPSDGHTAVSETGAQGDSAHLAQSNGSGCEHRGLAAVPLGAGAQSAQGAHTGLRTRLTKPALGKQAVRKCAARENTSRVRRKICRRAGSGMVSCLAHCRRCTRAATVAG